MNRRTILIASIVALLIITLTWSAQRLMQLRTTSPRTSSSVQYTNPATGQAVNDLPGEVVDQANGNAVQGGATISGFDALYSRLTTAQAANAQQAIGNFLMARSGLATVQAGVRSGSVAQSGATIQFVLVVTKPQVTYRVSLWVANQFQSEPTITYTEVE